MKDVFYRKAEQAESINDRCFGLRRPIAADNVRKIKSNVFRSHSQTARERGITKRFGATPGFDRLLFFIESARRFCESTFRQHGATLRPAELDFIIRQRQA